MILGVLKKSVPNLTILSMPFSNVTGFTDVSSYARIFTTVSGPPLIVSDINSSTGFSAHFTSDLINTPANANMNFNTEDFTIEFFLRQTTPLANLGLFGRKLAPNATSSWNIRMNSGKIALQLGNGSSSMPLLSSLSTVATNVRQHFAFVKTGTTLKIYIDGVLDATLTAPADVFDSSAPLGIGSSQADVLATGANMFIDNLRIRKEAVYSGASFTVPSVPFAF